MGTKKKDDEFSETPTVEVPRPVTFETIAVETLKALVAVGSNDAHRHDIVSRALARVDAMEEAKV